MINTFSAITRSLQCGEVLAPMRTSSAVDYIVCNLFKGYVRVAFTNGHCYSYDARKRDILQLLSDTKISFGFWVNNCLNLDAPTKCRPAICA